MSEVDNKNIDQEKTDQKYEDIKFFEEDNGKLIPTKELKWFALSHNEDYPLPKAINNLKDQLPDGVSDNDAMRLIQMCDYITVILFELACDIYIGGEGTVNGLIKTWKDGLTKENNSDINIDKLSHINDNAICPMTAIAYHMSMYNLLNRHINSKISQRDFTNTILKVFHGKYQNASPDLPDATKDRIKAVNELLCTTDEKQNAVLADIIYDIINISQHMLVEQIVYPHLDIVYFTLGDILGRNMLSLDQIVKAISTLSKSVERDENVVKEELSKLDDCFDTIFKAVSKGFIESHIKQQHEKQEMEVQDGNTDISSEQQEKIPS